MSITRQTLRPEDRVARPGAGLAVPLALAAVVLLRLLAAAVLLAPLALLAAWLFG